MISRWYKLKNRAISLRKEGQSIGYIEKILGINRSTLSGWLKNISLTKRQKEKLLDNSKRGLLKAQKKGGQWHQDQGNQRKLIIRKAVNELIPEKFFDKKTGELIMAAFYLAEGTKQEGAFIIANSNTDILKSIISLLRYLYPLDESKFRCCLHLRSDQNEKELKSYWSKLLRIPEEKFLKTQFDKRTLKKTYEHYKGVCVLYYYDTAIQRRILYIGEKIISMIK